MGEAGGHLPSMRLDGRTALVTGAGRGIGRACALALAEAGAEVVAWSRTGAELDALVTDIAAAGGRARGRICDVTDAAAVRAGFAEIGRLDVLLNNVGGNRPQPFLEVSEENLDWILGLNVRSAFLVAQAAARIMVAAGGGA